MSELIGDVFVYERSQNNEKIDLIVERLNLSVLKDYPYFKKSYIKRISKECKGLENDQSVLDRILNIIAQ